MRWPAPARNGRTASPTGPPGGRGGRAENLRIIEAEGLHERASGPAGDYFADALASLPTTLVGEARSCGLLGALELVEDKEAWPLLPARAQGRPDLPRALHCERPGDARGARCHDPGAAFDHHGGRDRPDRAVRKARPGSHLARSRHRLAPGPGAFSHARLASSLHPLGHRGRALPRMGGVALELLRFGDARRPRHPAAWPPGGATVIPRGRRGSSASWRRLWRCCRGCPPAHCACTSLE